MGSAAVKKLTFHKSGPISDSGPAVLAGLFRAASGFSTIHPRSKKVNNPNSRFMNFIVRNEEHQSFSLLC